MPFAPEIWLQITNNSITTLNHHTVGNAGVKDVAEALKINQSITTIDLNYNNIGYAGVRYISEALKINTFITTIDLSYNQIGDAGAKDIAEALKINTFITTIDLTRNKIGETGAKDIAEALKINQSITTINLTGNYIGYSGVKDIAEALKINQSITTINLAENLIRDAGAKDIAEALKINQSITTIDLSFNQIGYAGARDIAEALKINQSITTINLTGYNIGYSGVKDIAEALKINQSITTIELNDNNIGGAGARDIAEALKINHSITTIGLRINQIGDAGAKDIAEALKINQSITTINLTRNNIGDAGAKDIAEALKINQSITTINLKVNNIGNSGVKDIAEALKINQSITTIDLGFDKIGDAGARDIAEALKINQSITTINLTGNNIGYSGVKDIAEALKINQSITTIDLGFNQIGDAGAKDIAEALKINKVITTINLNRNKIGDAGAQDIALALKINQYNLKIKEAKRLEQQEKLREQEETKEIKAAKLKALEKAKVKEYRADIQVVNIFQEVEVGEDNQFDNVDQSTMRQVSNLMREGYDRLLKHEKGILLLGSTRAGKSTLAHLLSGRGLNAFMEEETNDMLIDAKQPLEGIVISHNSASQTKIPNKCFAKDIIIWDCPGFNDTDPVQEIANSFYIKRIFEITDELKFVLVIAESDLRNERGGAFLQIVSNFMKSFEHISFMERSVSLVVTQVSEKKNIQHIGKSIEKVLKDNQRAKKEHKRLDNLLEKCSKHLFHRPNEEGDLAKSNLLEEIDSSSTFSVAKGDMINITISMEAKKCSYHLLNAACSNFNKLLEIIVKAIAVATNNVFSKNYNLVKDWIPSSILYNKLLQEHYKYEYFLELDFLSKLQEVLKFDQIASIQDAIIIFQEAVDIFAEYVELDNVDLQQKIQDYGYCLQQQYEYVKFFASVCEVKLPDHKKIAEVIKACHNKVTENLEYKVSSLSIDEKNVDQAYYHKAVKYMEKYPNSPPCKNLKAIAYSCLANIIEQDDEQEALAYCVKAIDSNRHLPKIYKKLGYLFSKSNEYAKAINCYKVVNNEFMIKDCFKAWLKQDKNNPDIMLKQAEYFDSIGMFEQAKKYYHHAFSLSEDNHFKAAVLNTIGNIMINAAAVKGQDFITRAGKHDFYNYDLVDETFINNLGHCKQLCEKLA